MRQEDRQGRHALVQVVEEASDVFEEVLAHVVPVEAAGGRQDGQTRERRQQVRLALLYQIIKTMS